MWEEEAFCDRSIFEGEFCCVSFLFVSHKRGMYPIINQLTSE